MAKLRKLTTLQFGETFLDYRKYIGPTIEISVNSLIHDYNVDVISKRRKEFCQDGKKTNYMWGLEVKPGMFFVAYDWKKVVKTKSEDVVWNFALYGKEWTDDDKKNYDIITRAITMQEPVSEEVAVDAGPFIAQAAETRYEDEKNNIIKTVFGVLYNHFVKKDERYNKYIKEVYAYKKNDDDCFVEVVIIDYFKTEYRVTIFPHESYESMKHKLGTTLFDMNNVKEAELIEAIKKIIEGAK